MFPSEWGNFPCSPSGGLCRLRTLTWTLGVSKVLRVAALLRTHRRFRFQEEPEQLLARKMHIVRQRVGVMFSPLPGLWQLGGTAGGK